MIRPLLLIVLCQLLTACVNEPASYDVILRGGTIYDGSGGKPYLGDVAFKGDLIAALGDIGPAKAPVDIDVKGFAVLTHRPGLCQAGNEVKILTVTVTQGQGGVVQQ